MLAAIRLLQALGLVGDICGWFHFYLNQLFNAVYGTVTGQDASWLFFNDGAPVQMKYTLSMTREAPWWYNQRTHQWVYRGTQYGERGYNLPFVMCTLHTPVGEYELTEFFSEHKYYFSNRRNTFPSSEQLLSSWSIESHIWLTDTQKDNSYYTIMGSDCEDYTIPIIMDNNEEATANYKRLFGVEDESDEASESESDEESDEESGDEEKEEEESDKKSSTKEEQIGESKKDD